MVSIEDIKAYSGNFDAEVILYIFLRKKKIEKIPDLVSFCSLILLDLSYNLIKSIIGINKLYNLKYLYISNCLIYDISDLNNKTLEILDLRNNYIDNIYQLNTLKNMNLKKLYLQNVDGSYACPVCSITDYTEEYVLTLLPNLHVLDGRRLHLRKLTSNNTLKVPSKLGNFFDPPNDEGEDRQYLLMEDETVKIQCNGLHNSLARARQAVELGGVLLNELINVSN
eukprot:GHVL01008662.1.p1 GENE.GHVL01008662.1~~GHVL01008662.1.p1  ORF type:complete len:225 (+),score=59.98 GHVL01008662.1:373-1047(+)